MKEVIEKSLIYLDRTNKVYFIVWGLLMGSALTYAVYLESNYTFYKLCYNKLLQTIPHGEFYSTIAEVIATVFGISIPIAIGIVADHLKQYNDRGIANLFRNERIFKNHLFHSLVLLMACIVLEFIDFKQSIWQLFVIIYFIYLVIQFRSFVLLVIEYSSNTDELIFKNN
ncbi:MAG: hypothetical protein IPI23_00850 [Bacteroidetes bacterium]|nr:hypothetical protein [Bacteroidota bacterium]